MPELRLGLPVATAAAVVGLLAFVGLSFELGTGSASGVTSVTAGSNHTCVITDTSSMKCWGNNAWRQLGDGSQAVQRFVPGEVLTEQFGDPIGGIVAAEAGGRHTCALTSRGAVLCWGDNEAGQLGIGTNGDGDFVTIDNAEGIPTLVPGIAGAVSLAPAGSLASHTCVVLVGGEPKCWGQNEFGQLGIGSNGDGDVFGLDSFASVPQSIVGLTSGVTAMGLGAWHTCAVTSGNGLKCWGSNEFGQLGVGTSGDGLLDTLDSFSNVPVDVCAATPCSGVIGGIVDVAPGAFFTCALTLSGGVKCWGANSAGQLGNGTTVDSSTPVDVAGLSNVVAITAGHEHACALTGDGGVKCWGGNTNGQIGNGTTSASVSLAVNVTGMTTGVANVSASGSHTCAVTAGGDVKCWGHNDNGELGDNMACGVIACPLAVDVHELAKLTYTPIPTFTSEPSSTPAIDTATPTATDAPPTDTPAPGTATSTPAPLPPLVGDVDCSGTVNAIDAAIILQFGAALIDELPCPLNGDANGDGMTSAVDAALVLQFVAGLVGDLPV